MNQQERGVGRRQVAGDGDSARRRWLDVERGNDREVLPAGVMLPVADSAPARGRPGLRQRLIVAEVAGNRERADT